MAVRFLLVGWLLIISFFLNSCRYLTEEDKISLGLIETLAGQTEIRFGEVFGVALGADNSIFVSDGANGKIWRVGKDAAMSLVTDKLDTPSAIAIDKDNSLIVADSGTHTIKRINPTNGEVSTVAGVEKSLGYQDGAANIALFNAPVGVAVDQSGRIYVADTYNDRVRVIENDIVRTLAGGEQGFADAAIGAEARFDTPCGVAIAPDNTIIVADTGNRRIRKISADGAVTTIAGTGDIDNLKIDYSTLRGSENANDNGNAESNAKRKSNRRETQSGSNAANEKAIQTNSNQNRVRHQNSNGGNSTINSNANKANAGKSNFNNSIVNDENSNDEKDATTVKDESQKPEFVEPVGVAVDRSGTIYVADAVLNTIRALKAGRATNGSSPPNAEPAPSNVRTIEQEDPTFGGFNRPTNLAIHPNGTLFIADSANKVVRTVYNQENGSGQTISAVARKDLFLTAEGMRAGGEPRWCYDPPIQPREIAATFGEIRGRIHNAGDFARFHNGLDVPGEYGETARFIRSEKVLLPRAVQEYGTARELIRMPTVGYIHVRLGRDQSNRPFDDARFQFGSGRAATGVRVRRGTRFSAGEPIGTLNTQRHVHLIAGESGAEMNAFIALELPGVRDTVAPKINEVRLHDENFNELKPQGNELKVAGRIRIVVRAYDQMDGNEERRRLGVFRLGYQVLNTDGTPTVDFAEPRTTISLERLPRGENAANFVFAPGSRAGASGGAAFNYIVTNNVIDGAAREDFLDTTKLPNGDYKIRAFAADYFGNQTTGEVAVRVSN